MDLPDGVQTWIVADNLERFLRIASEYVSYCFSEADWDAVRFGVQGAAAGGTSTRSTAPRPCH